jgi:hypothetical protein
VQFLQQCNSKSELWKNLLRKFVAKKYPTYNHCISECVILHVFKIDSAAIFRAEDGHAASVQEYDRCNGFLTEIIYNNVLSATKRYESSKKSIKFGQNLLHMLKDGDSEAKSKVIKTIY